MKWTPSPRQFPAQFKLHPDELKQQLVAFAIHSFGENPTRYYDAAKNEAASPTDLWLDRIPFFNKPSKSVSSGATEK